MFRITITQIPPEAQRYHTLGDWQIDPDGAIAIFASGESSDEAFAIAVHELVEAWLCQRAGISQQEVDQFDMGDIGLAEAAAGREPGEHPLCPYRIQHAVATEIENLLYRFLCHPQ